MCDHFKLARSHSGDIFVCLFLFCFVFRALHLLFPAWTGAEPVSYRSCTTEIVSSEQCGVSGGSFHSGLLLKSSFPFPGSATCYRKFPVDRHWPIVSIAAVQGQRSAQVALEQLQ